MAFNGQQFADLLRSALGNRSINKYGNDSDVDPGYISRLMRCKTKRPPSADIIKKLANKAYNDITAEQFQEAAGYLNPNKSKPAPLQISQEDMELLEIVRKLKNLPDKDRKEVESYIKYKEQTSSASTDEQAAAVGK